MKIVIAPDSWKESLSALEVASAIEQGFREIYPDAEYVKLPVADGGEGTVEAMVAATGGLLVPLTVTGPLGEPVTLISVLPFTGLPLLIAFLIAVIFMSILIPTATTKWEIISPIMVPLLMRSNIAPNFTQFVFRVGDGIGKSITPDKTLL